MEGDNNITIILLDKRKNLIYDNNECCIVKL